MRLSLLLTIAAICFCCAGCGSTSSPNPATHPTTRTGSSFRKAQTGWLGLNYNSGIGGTEYPSGSGAGQLRQFAAHGVTWNRLGNLEIVAGSTVANLPSFRQGLRVSVGAGMVPDVLVDPGDAPRGCRTDPEPEKLCLPTTKTQIAEFVRGFVATASSVLHAYPHSGAVFEPMNEPWDWPDPPGTESGRTAASEYAAILRSLLPAVVGARIPLADVYVPLTGTLADGSSWVPDLYAAQPCLRPGHGTCGPISGWNAHPYGLPNTQGQGIDAVLQERSALKSGSDNIIISEAGFCSTEVEQGQACDLNVSQVDGTSAQTSRWLTETLRQAATEHRAGWLRAFIIWARSFGGWSMQTSSGQLTAQGQVLTRFGTGSVRPG